MSIRNCGELGLDLQKIVSRLLANDNLVKLLYYENKDPFGEPNLTKEEKEKLIYQKLIKIVPQYKEDDNNKSVLMVYINKGTKIPGNKEFMNLQIVVDVFVPLDTWIIKDINLRPFAILGEIQNSLEGKTINGLGRIEGNGFALTDMSEKMSVYSQTFQITEYD